MERIQLETMGGFCMIYATLYICLYSLQLLQLCCIILIHLLLLLLLLLFLFIYSSSALLYYYYHFYKWYALFPYFSLLLWHIPSTSYAQHHRDGSYCSFPVLYTTYTLSFTLMHYFSLNTHIFSFVHTHLFYFTPAPFTVFSHTICTLSLSLLHSTITPLSFTLVTCRLIHHTLTHSHIYIFFTSYILVLYLFLLFFPYGFVAFPFFYIFTCIGFE